MGPSTRSAAIAALIALTIAIAGCTAPPPAAPAAASSTPAAVATTAASPTTAEVLLPDEGRRSDAPDERTDWITDRSPGQAWLLDACQPTDYPTDLQRVSFRTVSQTGPESFHARQLAEYPDPAVADQVMAGFRRALVACSTGQDRNGNRWEWRTQNIDGLGEDALLAATTQATPEGVPLGGSRVVVTRVGNKVFLAYTFGEFYTAEFDHGAEEAREVAQRFVDSL